MAIKKQDIPEIRHAGKEIVIPEGMTNPVAIDWLQKAEAAAQQVVNFREEFDAFPWDGAVSFAAVIKETYGFAKYSNTTDITVPCGPGETTVVRWGRVSIPGIEAIIAMDGRVENGVPLFTLVGTCKAKDREKIAQLADAVRMHLAKNSMYRGKAVRLQFPEGDFDLMSPPSFLDLSQVNPAELILPADADRLVNYSLFTPLRHADACKRAGIPLKRGVLLAGPYGCGKTLTAMVAAYYATRHGWTFVYIPRVGDLGRALLFAKRFQPCVIFAEDLDRTDRDDVNALQNTLDGVDTKRDDIMVVLTTNHPDAIPQSLLRPGRMDAVISVAAPDAPAVARLLRLYGRSLLSATTDLTTVATKLAGKLPAFVRECVERAKLAAVSRDDGSGGRLVITSADLDVAADSMLHHMALLTPRPVDRRSDVEKAAATLATSLDRAAYLADLRGVPGLTATETSARRELHKQLALTLPTASPALGNGAAK